MRSYAWNLLFYPSLQNLLLTDFQLSLGLSCHCFDAPLLVASSQPFTGTAGASFLLRDFLTDGACATLD